MREERPEIDGRDVHTDDDAPSAQADHTEAACPKKEQEPPECAVTHLISLACALCTTLSVVYKVCGSRVLMLVRSVISPSSLKSRLKSLCRRLGREPELQSQYNDVFKKSSGVIEQLPEGRWSFRFRKDYMLYILYATPPSPPRDLQHEGASCLRRLSSKT